jgi:hypothetical protein
MMFKSYSVKNHLLEFMLGKCFETLNYPAS